VKDNVYLSHKENNLQTTWRKAQRNVKKCFLAQ